jgi:UDP-N-acetylglucosamine--N-acetylmuramyl-(pentapeptide) pyrophosphoryl-undecaprenol N-acetylglucosamine transferase
VEGWPRKRSLRQAWVAAKLALGVARSMMYIKTLRPQVVVGVGGYVSLPLCYAAQRLGVPTVLHEQNKRLGMANRLLASRATRLLLSYPDTLGDYPREKSRVVGNPVRAGFANSRPSNKSAANSSRTTPTPVYRLSLISPRVPTPSSRPEWHCGTSMQMNSRRYSMPYGSERRPRSWFLELNSGFKISSTG